jgi:allantoate deiminase
MMQHQPDMPAGSPMMRRLDELALCSSEPDALTRLYLTPEHRAAAVLVLGWMRGAGMAAAIDAAGNVVGRYEGRVIGARALLIGSHIDTVRNAGKYDGAFGVIAGIEAVARLHASGERLDFAIEVIAFGDEEGVRFPATLTGSRAIAGTLDPAVLDGEDAAGISLRAALEAFGCEPAAIAAVARRRADVIAYIELHIEQGPVLESEGLAVGVVTAINGASRLSVTLGGQAGHAGTVPMGLRRDAAAAMAEMVLAVERLAGGIAACVATVGRVEVLPGAVNVIPATARFSIDLRHPDDDVRRDALARLHGEMAAIAARRGVDLAVRTDYDVAAAVCAADLIAALAESVRRVGLAPRRLPSGAGHDGLAIASLCPIAMLFLRCRGGISHHPAEAILAEDADLAVRVLDDFLRRFDPVIPALRAPGAAEETP